VSMPKIKLMVPLREKRFAATTDVCSKEPFNEHMDEYEERGKKRDKFMSQNLFLKNSSLWQAVRTPLQLSSITDNFTSKVFTFIHQL